MAQSSGSVLGGHPYQFVIRLAMVLLAGGCGAKEGTTFPVVDVFVRREDVLISITEAEFQTDAQTALLVSFPDCGLFRRFRMLLRTAREE